MTVEELVQEFLSSPAPESTLRRHVDTAIETLRARTDSASLFRPPGTQLRLLLVGYSGAGNVGADVRVAELVRQLRAIFAGDDLSLTLTTVGEHLPQATLQEVTPALVDTYLPVFLADHCGVTDAVVACEGSMFKSTFSNSLSMLMVGALGMGSAAGKAAIAYGAEAGKMDEELRGFVERHCGAALVICRNERSRHVLEPLGLRTRLGADPAWTFEAACPERAEEILRDRGWDGDQPVLAVCPMNPFWWPVRPDPARLYELEATGAHRDEHYVSIFFHESSEAATSRYDAYIRGLVRMTDGVRRERRWFPVIVGMERLDRRACEHLAAGLKEPAPVLVSGDVEPAEIVAVLRASRLLVSSRYHALITAMPGLVPGIGVSMDERIDTVLGELGRPELAIPVDASDLAERSLATIRMLEERREAVREDIGRLVAAQVRRLGEAGIHLVDEVLRFHPDCHAGGLPRTWEAHLPPLPDCVSAIMDVYA